jgi:hypothetical protein
LACVGFSLLALATSAWGVTRTWDGGGGDNAWGTAANWSSDTVPATNDQARLVPLTVPIQLVSNQIVGDVQFSGTPNATMVEGLGQTLTIATGKISGNGNGSRQDLWRIADALLDAQLAPFATVFDSQMRAQSGVLARYEDVWVITNALAEGVLEQVRASGRRVREFDRKLDGLDDAVAALRPTRPSRLPANVLAAVGDTSVALFERKGKGGTVRLHALPAMAKGQGRLVADDGREIAAGSTDAMRSEGYAIPLAPWSATRLNWAPDAAASR